jgi:hypothetical protein
MRMARILLPGVVINISIPVPGVFQVVLYMRDIIIILNFHGLQGGGDMIKKPAFSWAMSLNLLIPLKDGS